MATTAPLNLSALTGTGVAIIGSLAGGGLYVLAITLLFVRPGGSRPVRARRRPASR